MACVERGGERLRHTHQLRQWPGKHDDVADEGDVSQRLHLLVLRQSGRHDDAGEDGAKDDDGRCAHAEQRPPVRTTSVDEEDGHVREAEAHTDGVHPQHGQHAADNAVDDPGHKIGQLAHCWGHRQIRHALGLCYHRVHGRQLGEEEQADDRRARDGDIIGDGRSVRHELRGVLPR